MFRDKIIRRFLKAVNKDKKLISKLKAQVTNDYLQFGGKCYYGQGD